MAGLNVPSFALIILCCVSASRSLNPTPYFIWTNNGNAPKTSDFEVSFGKSISYDDMQKNYLKRFLHGSSKTTVLFLQDKLSLDDLTKYSNKASNGKQSVFENLKKFLGTKSALTLPFVNKEKTDSNLVASLRKEHNGHFEEVYSSDIDVWKYPSEKISVTKNNLFVFHLQPVKGSTEAGKISSLSHNDDLIGKFVNELGSKGLYTAILSSSEPSDIVEKMQNDELNENDQTEQLKRHLLSVDTPVKGFYNFSDCVYIFASSIQFSFGSESNTTVNFSNSSFTLSGKCSTNQSSVSIVFKKPMPANVEKFDLRMKFVQRPNTDWVCSSMQVTFSGTLNNTKETDLNLEFPTSAEVLNAPRAFSYSCGKVSLPSVNSTATLSFANLQVQPFDVYNKQFSNPYDCVPFFTIPILTGIFVSALLISVLFGGVMAMMSISTMDRFDDPKGPTIQVPHE